MKTSKPFATISYNSKDFLLTKLDEFCLLGHIDFFAFVEHFAEDDETKNHKHLYVVPSGRIDTEQLRKALLEIDPLNPAQKPLGCLPCKSSKFADWFLYSLHDSRYLASKGQSRKYHYTKEDFFTSDNDFFIEEIHTIDMSKLNRLDVLVNAVDNNIPFEELVRNGIIPMQQFVGYERAYNLLSHTFAFRNGRLTHNDEVIDLETGEVEFDPQLTIAFDSAIANKKK